MNTSTTAQNTSTTSTKGTTMNNSIVNFKITSGSTCCSVGGFTNHIVSVPVSEILLTPVCRAVDLFNAYVKDVGDIQFHFGDTLVFCQEEYFQENQNNQKYMESGLEFCKIIAKVYPRASKNALKDFLQINSFSISTPTPTKSQGTNMNTITFEQAVYNRITTCKTWNATRLNTVVRDMWSKDKSLIKGETTGDFIAKFFANFRGDLQARRFNFFDSHLVVEIYNRTWNEHINATPKEDYIKDVIEAPVVIQKPIYEVNVYTDGSCNVGAGTGGWGTFFTIEGHTKFNKELSGCAVETTNNAMELTAVLEALKAMNLTKEGFVFNIITDSKYVLQSLSNKNRYISQGFKKAANIEILKEIFSVMDAKGIKLESCPTNITGNKSIQSGDTVLKTVDGKINFLWVKGHSDNEGNDRADKLALNARKQLEKGSKESSDVVVPEMALEASNVSVVDSTVDQKMVTKDMIENAKTFDDIKHIISLSEDLKLGGTCGEDFTYYTKVLHKGKSVFEIVSPERVSSREGYIKSAARQLVQYLKAEGIYSDSNSSVDSVPSVEVTPSDLV